MTQRLLSADLLVSAFGEFDFSDKIQSAQDTSDPLRNRCHAGEGVEEG